MSKETVMETQESIEAKKLKSLRDALGSDGDTQDDALLLATLLDDKGELKVDLSLPQEYELEVMADQLLAHLGSYRQNWQAWRAARNTGDHANAKRLFDQMQFNKLTSAIIQASYPRAKALADELGQIRAKTARDNRKRALENEEAA